MNRRNLLVFGGLAVVAFLVFRRRKRRRGVEIEIDEPGSRDRTTATGASGVELESIEGIGSAYAERLREAGIRDGADLVAADPDELAFETGIGENRIRGWIDRIEDRSEA